MLCKVKVTKIKKQAQQFWRTKKSFRIINNKEILILYIFSNSPMRDPTHKK